MSSVPVCLVGRFGIVRISNDDEKKDEPSIVLNPLKPINVGNSGTSGQYNPAKRKRTMQCSSCKMWGHTIRATECPNFNKNKKSKEKDVEEIHIE